MALLATVGAVTTLYALAYCVYGPILAMVTKRLTADAPDAEFAWCYGIVTSVFPLWKALGAPIIGRLSDRIGRRGTMVLTTILSGACFAGTARAATLVQLIVWRSISGILSGNGTVMVAYISENTSADDRPRAMNVFNWAWNVATVLAGAVLWALNGDIILCCDASLVLMVAAAGAAWLLMTPQSSSPSPVPKDKRKPASSQPSSSMLSVLMLMLSHSLSWQLLVTQAITPVFDLGPLVVTTLRGDAGVSGTIKSVSSALGVLLPLLPLTQLLQGTGASHGALAAIGCACTAAATVLVGLCSSAGIPALILSCSVREVSVVISRPFLSSALLSSTPHHDAGAFSGWRECMKAIALACSSLLLGYLTAIGSPQLPFYVAGVGLTAQAAVYAVHATDTQPDKQE